MVMSAALGRRADSPQEQRSWASEQDLVLVSCFPLVGSLTSGPGVLVVLPDAVEGPASIGVAGRHHDLAVDQWQRPNRRMRAAQGGA